MAAYEYSCGECGRFTVRRPIGTAPDRHTCPNCAAMARRAFSPPALGRAGHPLSGLRTREEQSRHEPAVVSHVPDRLDRRTRSPVHPTLARLPRP